jgi:hypothetical protein
MPADYSSGKDQIRSSLKSLPHPQKIAVGFLFTLSLLVLVFWVWQIRGQINRPFDYGRGTTAEFTATSTDFVAVLKERDTDGDGLSDYDEIYVYFTSPYLEDSDSDGMSDYEEIRSGRDPNCPQGQNCSEPAFSVGSPAAGLVEPIPGLTGNDLDDDYLQRALSGQADAAMLRQLLLAGGASQEELDLISDEELMRSYQETLTNQGSSTNP